MRRKRHGYILRVYGGLGDELILEQEGTVPNRLL